MGMTSQQFWEDDPELYWAYLEAENQKRREQVEYDNALAHRLGLYIKLAIGSNFEPKIKYPKEPFSLGLVDDKPKTKKSENDKWSAFLHTSLKVKNKN